MKLHSPFFISSRLLPAVRCGKLVIQIETLPREYGGRSRYRYTIDKGAKTFSKSDMRSGYQGGSTVEGFGAILAFLDWASTTKGERLGFPKWIWGAVEESEMGAIREMIEPDGRINHALIEE